MFSHRSHSERKGGTGHHSAGFVRSTSEPAAVTTPPQNRKASSLNTSSTHAANNQQHMKHTSNSNKNSSTENGKGGQGANNYDEKSKSHLVRKPSRRSFRQDLFKAVTSSQPRCSTPGRRASSVSLMLNGRSGFMTSPQRSVSSDNEEGSGPIPVTPRTATTRKDRVRSRWHKAVQQQLLLIRMAKEVVYILNHHYQHSCPILSVIFVYN